MCTLTPLQFIDDSPDGNLQRYERLFRRIMNNSEHVLQPFLPDRPDLSYNLRWRPHCNKSLITKAVDLSNNNYIIRATYKDSYWNYSKPKLFYHCIFICFTYLYFHLCSYLYYGCVCQLFNKRQMMMMIKFGLSFPRCTAGRHRRTVTNRVGDNLAG